jgi:hypothetical protein
VVLIYRNRSRGILFHVKIGNGLDNRGTGVRFLAEARALLHSPQICSGTNSVDIDGSFPPDLNRPGYEFDHSLPSSVEVQNASSHISAPSYIFMEWCLIN